MGTLVGHVAPGLGFMLIGLWHLFNHIKLHTLNPNSYTSFPWFPTSKSKYMELFLIMAASTGSVSMELFIGPDRHQPLDPDGSIPSNHLHNLEHSSISLTFFTYAAFSIILDKRIHTTETKYALTQLLASVAFGQQLLLFHLHSADHMGPEGQYHLLLQLLILVSLSTTLLGIQFPKSFLVSFMRSVSIYFQGLWLVIMGIALWTPELIPKGCFMNDEQGHLVVRCHDHESVHRANSLVNIQFSWFIILVTVSSVSLYLVMDKFYGGGKVQYFSLGNEEEAERDEEGGGDVDVESQKRSIVGNPMSFIQDHDHVGKTFSPLDIER